MDIVQLINPSEDMKTLKTERNPERRLAFLRSEGIRVAGDKTGGGASYCRRLDGLRCSRFHSDLLSLSIQTLESHVSAVGGMYMSRL